MTDAEFTALLESLNLPTVDVEETYRADVTRAGHALHTMDHDEIDKLVAASKTCAALALAWHERVLRAAANANSAA